MENIENFSNAPILNCIDSSIQYTVAVVIVTVAIAVAILNVRGMEVVTFASILAEFAAAALVDIAIAAVAADDGVGDVVVVYNVTTGAAIDELKGIPLYLPVKQQYGLRVKLVHLCKYIKYTTNTYSG